MKTLRICFALLCLALPAFAQFNQSGTLTSSSSNCNANNCIYVNLAPVAAPGATTTLVVTITGSFTGTVQFEASGDNGNTRVAIAGIPLAGGNAVTSATAAGTWAFQVAALTNFYARASALSAGSPSVTLQAGSGTQNVASTYGTLNVTQQYLLNGLQITLGALSDGGTVCSQSNAVGGTCNFNYAPGISALGAIFNGTSSGQGTLFGPATAGGSWILPDQTSGAVNLISDYNRMYLNADFTDGSGTTSLQAITGLSRALVANAVKSFHCMIMYSQATVVSDSFGIGVITTAPVNANATGLVNTNTGAAPAPAAGVLSNLNSTTPSPVVTFTPAVTTVLRAELDGTVEAGASASTFQLYVSQSTAANVIVIKRGSYCMLY